MPQTAAVASTFPELINYGIGIINFAIPVLIAATLVMYFYHAGRGIWNAGGESRAEMKDQLLWGAIILFVMISIWGILGFLENTFYLQ